MVPPDWWDSLILREIAPKLLQNMLDSQVQLKHKLLIYKLAKKAMV